MKRILSIVAAALLSAMPVLSQDTCTDSRGRVTTTIVADVLAQMPSQSEEQWRGDMSDLVQAAPRSVVLLAVALTDDALVTRAQYALKGLCDYVSGGAASSEQVRTGLVQAISESSDPVARAFLVSLLSPIATPAQEDLFRGLTGDEVSGPYAVAALESLGLMARPAPVEPAASLTSRDSYLRCAGAVEAIDGGDLKTALKTVRRAFATDDRAMRVTALNAASGKWGAEPMSKEVAALYKKSGAAARADILYWAADQSRQEFVPQVCQALGEDGEIQDAAFYAAARLGGEQAVRALIPMIGGLASDKAAAALSAIHGPVEQAVTSALAQALELRASDAAPADDARVTGLLRLASRKHMSGTFALVKAFSQEAPSVHVAALEALASVSGPDDADTLAAMLERSDAGDAPYLQAALASSLSSLGEAEEVIRVKEFMEGSRDRSLYYPVLAIAGSNASVSTLRYYYKHDGDVAAREALLGVKSMLVVPDLQEAASEGGPDTDEYIRRYLKIQASDRNPGRKRRGIEAALRLTGSDDIKAEALGRLARMYDPKSFDLASAYLDDSSLKVRYTAAKAVRDIASHTSDINYEDLRQQLGKASAIFAANGTADDGYAVTQIEKILREAVPAPVSELTTEEREAGFEMLFDGSSLDKWHGDLAGYTPVNGAIYVSAGYGSDGNLYTNKEYRNFVLRFEFCFLRGGVNNGVGVRTPEGVDAAYDGMCEVQILDHDDPVYAGLKEYQVHGSVYGVIPAKRIVHRPLGEWSTEEIVVTGDRVKVTVNGDVILDGDVREACGGVNVAPDGSRNNPGTVDHRNHPGLFNERGHISFCGHGEGLKLRNVRILELPD